MSSVKRQLDSSTTTTTYTRTEGSDTLVDADLSFDRKKKEKNTLYDSPLETNCYGNWT